MSHGTIIGRSHTATLHGIDAVGVEVEVDLVGGNPGTVIVGLPDKAVDEAKERVRSAIRSTEIKYTGYKVIVNLAPSDIRKEGAGMDLPIAAAILAAQGDLDPNAMDNTVMIGELALDGRVRRVDGALNVALYCAQNKIPNLIVPIENAAEAAIAPGVNVYGIRDLGELLRHFNDTPLTPFQHDVGALQEEPVYMVDFSDVKGQKHAIRALEIVAAGGHNVIMTGPPGSGKTMLARRVVTILPPLSLEESIEVTRIYSASGQKGEVQGLIWERPFRSPHHTTSYAAVVGGGKFPKPGEVSLAHHGVLFLDECPEFGRDVLEALRQPLEDSVITVSRVQATLTFPASCMLVAAMNPCPCGFKGYPEANCVGSPASCGKYAQRLSGPLMDRIDLHITVPRLKPDELMNISPGEPSSEIRKRVLAARARQAKRLGGSRTNARMTPAEIRDLIVLDTEAREFIKQVSAKMNLSARVFDRILKVSRTIADLADVDAVTKTHISEAVQYRERES